MVYLGAWENLLKNLKSKISWHCPFNCPHILTTDLWPLYSLSHWPLAVKELWPMQFIHRPLVIWGFWTWICRWLSWCVATFSDGTSSHFSPPDEELISQQWRLSWKIILLFSYTTQISLAKNYVLCKVYHGPGSGYTDLNLNSRSKSRFMDTDPAPYCNENVINTVS